MSENKKPRICSVLGVEVNTRFRITGYDHAFYVDDEGNFRKEDGDFVGYALFTAINHPEAIRPLPCWTDEEKEQAKSIRMLFPWARSIEKRNGAPSIGVLGDNYMSFDIFDEDGRLFPHLNVGESIALDEILGENA